VVTRRGGDALSAQPPIYQNGLFAAFFFVGAIGVTGMPPLSGFLGKLLVLDGVRDMPWMATAWAAILIGSLVTIVGFARAGSVVFWKATALADPEAEEPEEAEPIGVNALTGASLALAALALLAVFAGPVMGYLEQTAAQLFDVSGYVDAVLGQNGEDLK